jgi:hypothetical protein
VHSPKIDKIEVVRHGAVRRAKLYYLRKKIGKAAKIREIGFLHRLFRFYTSLLRNPGSVVGLSPLHSPGTLCASSKSA